MVLPVQSDLQAATEAKEAAAASAAAMEADRNSVQQVIGLRSLHVLNNCSSPLLLAEIARSVSV